MRRVVVTGLGFITSIGNSRAGVLKSLKETITGIEIFDQLQKPEIPVKLAGTIKGFTFPTARPDDWTIPESYNIPRDQLRSMSPNCVYGVCAMAQAIREAELTAEMIS